MRRPLVIYDFATAPFWISLYVWKILFSFFYQCIIGKTVCASRGRAYVPRPFAIGESAGPVAGTAQLEAAQRPLSQPEADLSPSRRGRVTSHDAADPVSNKKYKPRARIFKLWRSPGIDSKKTISPAYVARARSFKLLRSPGIDSKETIPPGFVAWWAGTTTLFLLGSNSPP